MCFCVLLFFFFQAEDGIRDADVTGVQTCALPICSSSVIILASPCCTPFSSMILTWYIFGPMRQFIQGQGQPFPGQSSFMPSCMHIRVLPSRTLRNALVRRSQDAL